MAKVIDTPGEPGTSQGTYPLGVSRPPLEVLDLPTPEEAFGVEKVGAKETIKYAIGPALIALGISVGSGEWLLRPLAIGTGGFRGFGWIILLSALLQVFYCMEIGRSVDNPVGQQDHPGPRAHRPRVGRLPAHHTVSHRSLRRAGQRLDRRRPRLHHSGIAAG